MSEKFVLGFGVTPDYFGWGKGVSLFPSRVCRSPGGDLFIIVVHSIHVPVQLYLARYSCSRNNSYRYATAVARDLQL